MGSCYDDSFPTTPARSRRLCVNRVWIRPYRRSGHGRRSLAPTQPSMWVVDVGVGSPDELVLRHRTRSKPHWGLWAVRSRSRGARDVPRVLDPEFSNRSRLRQPLGPPVADRAFDSLGPRRVEMQVAASNAASLRVCRKIGAVEDRIVPGGLELNGVRHDTVVFSPRSDLHRDLDPGTAALRA